MVDLDVAFIPTPKAIVQQMLQIAQVRQGEILFDLGAGDGRILIEASRRFGAQTVGVEIDPNRVTRIKERLRATGVQAKVIQADLMDVDLSSADVIAIYLSYSVNSKLAPKLSRELKPGARIVSLDYVLPGWVPEKEITIESGGVSRKLFLYRVARTKTN